MKVKLRLFATLRKYLENVPIGQSVDVEMPAGSTISDLAERFQIPAEELKICFVNGIICEVDQMLSEGDEVGMFPPIGGG